MNHEAVLKQISEWKGVESQYWVALEILHANGFLSEKENTRCRHGLDCYTGDLVTYKMLELSKFCKSILQTESVSTVVPATAEKSEIKKPVYRVKRKREK
jgi:hypothetical protein